MQNIKILDKRDALMYNPLTLAYLGDGVYELLVRERLVSNENKSNGKLHAQAKQYVCADGQNVGLHKIIEILTDEETAVFKRGRNADCGKHANIVAYKKATGLEALFGYLYLIGNVERIEELFDVIYNHTT